MICPTCGDERPKPVAVTPDTLPQQGDIFICPQCATPAVLTLSDGWKTLPPELLAELSPEEQKDIEFAIRNIKAYHRSENV